jgi:hypothetical protein
MLQAYKEKQNGDGEWASSCPVRAVLCRTVMESEYAGLAGKRRFVDPGREQRRWRGVRVAATTSSAALGPPCSHI